MCRNSRPHYLYSVGSRPPYRSCLPADRCPAEAQSAIVDSLERMPHSMRHSPRKCCRDSPHPSKRRRHGDRDPQRCGVASAGAHFAICSEIAYCTALGYWAKRELETAEEYLARGRSALRYHSRTRARSAGVVPHRARRYRRSAQAFQATLLRLDECRARDRTITATAISTLAIYAAELFDGEMRTLSSMNKPSASIGRRGLPRSAI